MDYAQAKDELRDFILQEGIKWNTGKVNGKAAKWIFDLREPLLTSKGSYLAASVLFEKLKNIEFDAIGGPSIAAEPLTSAFLLHAKKQGKDIRGFIVRKNPNDFGLRKKVEGPIKPGDRVVLIDDIINTGSSVGDSLRSVQMEGCQVVKMMCLVNFSHEGTHRYENVDQVFTLQDFNLEINQSFHYEALALHELQRPSFYKESNEGIKVRCLAESQDLIFMGCEDGIVRCVDRQGEEQWHYPLSEPASIIVSNGDIVFISINSRFNRSKLYAFSAKGQFISELSLRGRIHDMILQDCAYLTYGRKIICLSQDQQISWEQELSDEIAKIWVFETTLYCATTAGDLTCMDLHGKALWSKHFGAIQEVQAAGDLYMISADYLYRMSLDGKIRWWLPLKNHARSLYATGQSILVGCEQGYLYEYLADATLKHAYKVFEQPIKKIEKRDDQLVLIDEQGRHYTFQ